MTWKNKLSSYKSYIILAGLAIGAARIFDFLPNELPVAGAEYTKYVYLALIGLAMYTYWEFHWGLGSANFSRTVNPRNLQSSQQFQRDLQRQRGPTQRPKIRTDAQGTQSINPNESDIFERFNR